MKKQASSSKSIPALEYRDRLNAVHRKLIGLNYKTAYIYEYDITSLNHSQETALVNFWNGRNNDLKLLNQFEWIADNRKLLPNTTKQKSA